MKIAVCIKQVPDTTEIKIDKESNRLIRDGVPSIVNPFDTYALEVAVRLKESLGGTVTVISMGPEQAKTALKKCVSVGADNAYLVSDRLFGGSDTLATSYILSNAIRYLEKINGKFDIVFCGKQAIDGDTAQVGPELAEHLNLPQVTYVVDVPEVDGINMKSRRETGEGYEIVYCQLPTVVTVIKTDFEPRYPSLKSTLAANRIKIPVINSDSMVEIDKNRLGLKGSPTKVKKTFTPQILNSGIKIQGDTAKDKAKKLAALLSEANII